MATDYTAILKRSMFNLMARRLDLVVRLLRSATELIKQPTVWKGSMSRG